MKARRMAQSSVPIDRESTSRKTSSALGKLRSDLQDQFCSSRHLMDM
jgi:hypothetical protein